MEARVGGMLQVNVKDTYLERRSSLGVNEERNEIFFNYISKSQTIE